ncbi:MAG: cell division protein ZipA C-terminal FtsZ-binding domain-containing protein [Gammaproteobacteria bacterium]|nr:cell division protein ZipA C-terminal FtsZ-binding domain-containing protein [Gammaproteobacteria bacterium]
MENMLRLVFFLIGGFIVFLIFYDVLFRRRNRLLFKKELSPIETFHEPFIEANIPEPIESSSGGNCWNLKEDLLQPRFEFNTEKDGWNSKEDLLLPPSINPEPPAPVSTEDDIIIISVLAKPPEQFASYDLLQSISATGMHYGAMNIFHYYQPTDHGYITLFSLASATKPGTFDLNHMGDFSCIGLSLFMNKAAVPNPKQAFFIMLEKAQQLADDLNGELKAGPERIAWNDEVVERFLNQI